MATIKVIKSSSVKSIKAQFKKSFRVLFVFTMVLKLQMIQ